MAIESINPANGEVLRRFEALGEAAIRTKIGIAAEAFRGYGAVPFEHRALCLRKLAALLEGELDELAGTITAETGKPIESARSEIRRCVAACRFFAEYAGRMLAPEAIPTEASASYVRWDPLGVLLAVVSATDPFWAVFRSLAPTLMGGNVTLLKMAANVPQCGLAMESLVRRSGFPPGTLQTLLMEGRQVETVLSDERVAAVTVTGDETEGRAIAAQAGWLIKRSALHLNGSDAFVVMGSADVDAAAEAGARATEVRRYVVATEVYEQFEQRLVNAVERLVLGDPMRPGTDVGPMPTRGSMEALEAQVSAAVKAGARVLTGGRRSDDAGLQAGNFYKPTVLAGVAPGSSMARQAVQGPVVMLFRVRDLDEAIRLANNTPYGRTASVWTRDPAEQGRLVAEMECGAVYLNMAATDDLRLPSGGVKRSGYGRELSAAGLREFMNAKTVMVGAPAAVRAGGRAKAPLPIDRTR